MGLTQREREVLYAYVNHGTARQAGESLGISEQTVKNHLATVRHKMGTRNTLQAVLHLWKQGEIYE